MSIRISVAQLDFVVGDIKGNAQRILDSALLAQAAGAQVLLTPELSLSGYAAEDLYLRPQFLDACDDALKWLVTQTAGLKNLAIVVGHPQRVEGESLRQRLDRGPLPVDEAIEVCRQVAAALEVAHESGI
ncbi:MAG: nitrilase-related carbon-nitrogen hydrolase, partial [Burkholderiaceae bacterium]|nr:nitrilase-related carbon-nitrogen hydrolase [Burkholderiaceae bacterium]